VHVCRWDAGRRLKMERSEGRTEVQGRAPWIQRERSGTKCSSVVETAGLPGLSTEVRRATRRIVSACRYGERRCRIGLSAKLAVAALAPVPEVTGDLMAASSRLLPRPLPGENDAAPSPGSSEPCLSMQTWWHSMQLSMQCSISWLRDDWRGAGMSSLRGHSKGACKSSLQARYRTGSGPASRKNQVGIARDGGTEVS
jgi:hypothetical protein